MRSSTLFIALLCLGSLSLCASCRSSDEAIGLKTQLLDAPEEFDLEFKGVKSFSKGLLQRAARDEFRDFVSDGFRAPPIDDAAFAMEIFYRGRGFPFTKVGYDIQNTPGSKPRVTFRVEEGKRFLLGQVEFQGNKSFTQEQLESQIGGPTTRLFGLGSLYFVETEAENARSAIESLYFQRGHIDVQVEGPQIEFLHEESRASLQYMIQEGPRYSITSVDLRDLDGHDIVPIRARLQEFIGQAYFPRMTYEVGAAAADEMANRGYPDATATFEEQVDKVTGHVALEVELQSGPQVHISEIVIEGNTRTRSSFILRTLGFEEGDLFRRKLERRAFRDLYSSGLFDAVTINLEGEGNQRILRVSVEEAETISVYGEIGYGSYERARVLFGITENNLFGTGRSLRFEGKLAEKAESATVFFKDPYTIDHNNVLGASAFIEDRELVGFDSFEYGANISLTRHLTDSFRNVYGYEYRISDASDVDTVAPMFVASSEERVSISTLYLTNVLDTRNGIFMPSDGTWVRVRSEWAGDAIGSQLTFLKLDGRAVHYLPLSDASRLAGTIRLGVIAPIGSTEQIPLQERFYNGGQNTVRSFKFDELGPKDAENNPIGGEAYSVISAEYRHDLPGSFSAALFVDAGNVTLDYKDALDFADLRYAVGPGVRWLLPIGPLRLDWGINPNPRANEDDWVLQFSLGIAF